MSSIQGELQLNDSFSDVLYGIAESVYAAINAMDHLQQTMNADLNTASLRRVREEIDQTALAAGGLSSAIAALGNSNASVNAPAAPSAETKWQPDAMAVFSSTGSERYQQEIQNADAMLKQLSNTQNMLAKQAYNTMIFPPQAFQSMNSLAVRIDMIRDSIQKMEGNAVDVGTGQANAKLEQLRTQLNQAVQQQNDLNTAMENMNVGNANEAYLRLSQTVSVTEGYIRDNIDAQGQFNQEIESSTGPAGHLISSIKNAAASIVNVENIKKVLDISDGLVQTTSQLNRMNDGFQTTDELVHMVYAAAQDTKSSFSHMADGVALFGNNAKAAFGSSEEIVSFTDLLQKQLTLAGMSDTDSSNTMAQLSEAMGSGTLGGDELNRILGQAPNVMGNIGDYFGVPLEQLQQMTSQGGLSAQAVKEAIFAASDDINASFDSMPVTWASIWQSMQNTALMVFGPVLQRINDLANSESFQLFVNGAMQAMAVLANIVMGIFDLIGSAGSFISDNWSLISPVINGVLGALAAYVIYLGIVKGLELAAGAASAAMTVGKGLLAAATFLAAAATGTQTASQMGLNSAMYSCPIIWIIVLFAALITIIFVVCNAIAKMTGVASSGFGIICGVIAMAGAFMWNQIVGVLNAIIQTAWTIFVEPFISIIEWVLNVINGGFDSFGGMVANLLGQIISWVLSLGKVVSKIIDAIFGTDWTAGLSSLQDSVLEWGKNEDAITLDRDAPEIFERMEYGEAFDAGSDWGDGIAKKVSEFDLSELLGGSELEDYSPGNLNGDEYTSALSETGIPENLDHISADTGAMKDSMEVTNEDLKYLRDIAEREIINRFTTAEIKVDMTNHNTINKDMDLDGITQRFCTSIEEQMNAAAEGVH